MKNMIKLISLFMTVAFLFCACNDKNSVVSGGNKENTNIQTNENMVKISEESIVLSRGETYALTVATLNEVDAIEWSSVDSSVATVDSNGMVTGIANGNTVITASIGEYEKAYCNVTVKQEYLAEYACSLQCESLNLYIGDDYQLNATVRYGDEIITGAAISWYSSDMTVATVSKGVVKAVGSGEAVITAEFQAEDIKVFAQCKVNVLGFYDVSVLESATGIVANIGDTFNVTMEVYDANGDKLSQLDEKLIRYYSANENIVSYINGKYKAMSAGVTNLIVEYAGVTNVCPVRVGITTEAFQLISGGVGSGVRVSENGYFLYESKPSVDQETYVALSGEEWESALSKAKEKGYTKVSVTVYSINGVMKPRPCNTQYSVFDVEDDVFWLTRDKNVPFKETKLLSECENWPFMLFGMYGEGSFEFTISFE